MGLTLTSDEFKKKADDHHHFLMKCYEGKDLEMAIMLQLWELLKIEERLNPIIKHFGWVCVRKKHPTNSLYGEIEKNGKIVGYYSYDPWPSVVLLPFLKGRSEVTDKLIQLDAVKPIKGVHRILDWHYLIKNGYIQKLAKEQWVIHFVPETPTMEDLKKLLEQVKAKTLQNQAK